MYGADGPDTFWLNHTNIALGLATLACVLVIVAGVVHEMADRRRRRAAAADHALAPPGRGLTMADGGERIDRTKPAGSKDR